MSGYPDRQNSRGIRRQRIRQNQIVETLVDDLKVTFDNLRAYDIRLNPEKCVFGIPAGKLLGFIVSGTGIEANPAKIRALSQLDIPKDLKQIQKLTGCMAALSRFISRLGEKALPLYRLLRHTRRNKGHIGNESGPGCAQPGRTYVVIHRGNTSSSKRGAVLRSPPGELQICTKA